MRLDLDLIRDILLIVEKNGKGVYDNGVDVHQLMIWMNYDDREKAVFFEHVRLLGQEAKLIHIKTNGGLGNHTPLIRVFDLTWEGHQFVANTKNETVWKQFKQGLTNFGGQASWQVITTILTTLTKESVLNLL